MHRTMNSISKIRSLCLTVRIHFPHVYSIISLSHRSRLVSPRFRLVSRLRKIAALVGLVLCRGLGGSLAR